MLSELIAALRSGKYKQNRGRLRCGDSFCLTGVMCDLYDPSGWNQITETQSEVCKAGDYIYDGSLYSPSPLVRIHFGLTDDLIRVLSARNDQGVTFSQLADDLEKLCTANSKQS